MDDSTKDKIGIGVALLVGGALAGAATGILKGAVSGSIKKRSRRKAFRKSLNHSIYDASLARLDFDRKIRR